MFPPSLASRSTARHRSVRFASVGGSPRRASPREDIANRIDELPHHVRQPLEELANLRDVIRGNPHDERPSPPSRRRRSRRQTTAPARRPASAVTTSWRRESARRRPDSRQAESVRRPRAGTSSGKCQLRIVPVFTSEIIIAIIVTNSARCTSARTGRSTRSAGGRTVRERRACQPYRRHCRCCCRHCRRQCRVPSAYCFFARSITSFALNGAPPAAARCSARLRLGDDEHHRDVAHAWRRPW